jgi:hypothetical protein
VTLDLDFTTSENAFLDSVRLVFTRTGGAADPGSPHDDARSSIAPLLPPSGPPRRTSYMSYPHEHPVAGVGYAPTGFILHHSWLVLRLYVPAAPASLWASLRGVALTPSIHM